MAEFLNKLQTYDDYVSLDKRVSEKDIQKAEKCLELKFSEEYKDYTGNIGAASADGHEFTGVVDMPRLSVVQITNNEKGKNSSIPPNLYAVEKLGIDGITIWQDQNGVVYKTIRQGNPIVIARSLIEYL